MIVDVETRRAVAADADAIARAHRDSIRTLGSRFYAPDVVADWETGLTGDVYVNAMDRGEVFFVATGTVDGEAVLLGFASDYRIAGRTHGVSVYVRGAAARRGIGTALLGLAEAQGVSDGATNIQIEASLAAVAFYRANGFTESGRGEVRLTCGRPIACVYMRKDLGTHAAP